MALKYVLALVFVIFVVQLITADDPKPSSDIEDALNKIKSGIAKLSTDLKDNDMFANFTSMMKQFGQQIADQGQNLVKKIQEETNTKN